MITHNLSQGSQEWHAHRREKRNASDAPVVLGCSPYKTRTELLRERATGIQNDVDAGTQRLFDDGHRFEELARPIGEEIIGAELFPVVGSEGKFSASFDGLTMDESTAFEHKSMNDDLRMVFDDIETMAPEYRERDGGKLLPKMYRVQMEQQCMVSGCERALFMASKWRGEELIEERHCWYYPDAALRAEIVAGWEQFEADVAAYQHVEVLPSPTAEPTIGLPALSIQVNGSISLQSNLVAFGDRLKSFVEAIDMKPADDQSFANAEAAVKTLEKAQEALEAAESSALAQTASIDEMRRTVAMYRDLARNTRLALEKVVKTRKETIRIEIQQEAKLKVEAHIDALNQRLGKPYMPAVPVDFAGVMKGKKTISSLRDAVDTELACFKIEANAVADRIQANLTTLRELAADYAFLFADTAQIVLKATDDCTALIRLRIAEHKEAEEKRLAAERARIAEEERVKAEAAARAEADLVLKKKQDEFDAQMRAEREQAAARQTAVLEAAQARRTADSAKTPTEDYQPAVSLADVLNAAAPAEIAKAMTQPTLRLGEICSRIAPLSISADGLRQLGFEPAGRERSAVLYFESDWPAMRNAMASHIAASESQKQAA